MTSLDIALGVDALEARWADGRQATYPYLWLRDNCPSAFHPQTQERIVDLLAVDPDARPHSAVVTEEFLVIGWAGDGHVSRFPLAWLAAHRPGEALADPAAIAPRIWRADLAASGIARHAAAEVLGDDQALQAWMTETLRDGITILEGMADEPRAGVEVAQRVGFLRPTNFGPTFEVVNRPDPNNLAFTALSLPLHTDLPNQEVPPGFQFLHCIANEATGGGSLFADGYAIACDLREEEPEAFRMLSEVAVPFRFHDRETDIRVHAPVIALDRRGEPLEIRFNAHIAAVFDMPPDIMPAYYRAYRAFMDRTRQAGYRVALKLIPGEMVVFDNRRILHGREAFDPASGFRHLHGCYLDRGDFASRLRVLAARKPEPIAA
ncbi:MAG: TauD/TfdA family dioxygenase [Tistlia sp.]|uniref:TauD/TfdA family dioxygenase n=1 Tax=Tistlia sp. TaxID=3057121 RepID=UPI0034A2115F